MSFVIEPILGAAWVAASNAGMWGTVSALNTVGGILGTVGTVASVAAPLAATALGLAGTAMSAKGTYEAGVTQKGIYDYDADIAAQQAQAAQIRGGEETRQLSERKRKLIGSQIAGYGGAGVDPGMGTPLQVVADTYSQYERDIQTTGYNTDVAVRQDLSQADIYRWAGGRAYQAGQIGAGSTILGGVGRSLLASR